MPNFISNPPKMLMPFSCPFFRPPLHDRAVGLQIGRVPYREGVETRLRPGEVVRWRYRNQKPSPSVTGEWEQQNTCIHTVLQPFLHSHAGLGHTIQRTCACIIFNIMQDEFVALQAGADSKRKRYAALCWSAKQHTQEELRAKLGVLRNLEVCGVLVYFIEGCVFSLLLHWVVIKTRVRYSAVLISFLLTYLGHSKDPGASAA